MRKSHTNYVFIYYRATINTFLVIDLLGCCCVYIVFISGNVKQIVDHHMGYVDTDEGVDVRIFMAALLPLLIALALVRNLKHLSPFSMVANFLIAIGMAITFYYIFKDPLSMEGKAQFASIQQLPIFFGTAIFALEGIGVVSRFFLYFDNQILSSIN